MLWMVLSMGGSLDQLDRHICQVEEELVNTWSALRQQLVKVQSIVHQHLMDIIVIQINCLSVQAELVWQLYIFFLSVQDFRCHYVITRHKKEQDFHNDSIGELHFPHVFLASSSSSSFCRKAQKNYGFTLRQQNN